MIKKISFLLLILSLTACTGQRITTLTGFPLVPEETHLEGVKRTVYVGDAMTSSAPLIVIESITLKDNLAAATTHKGKPRELTAGPGTYTLVRQNPEGKFYEATGNWVTVNGRDVSGGLFLAKDNTRKSGLYWSGAWSRQVTPDRRLPMYIAELDRKPEVTMSSSQRPPNNHEDFVAILTYMGMAGGEIKFVYREYYDGLARAAFTQDIALDYEPGKTYAFKSARFIVHDANTSEVTYTLLQKL